MKRDERIRSLLQEAAKCCEALGLRGDLIEIMYRSDSDWTYILKIDALIETSAKEVVKQVLKLEVNRTFVGAAELEVFVSGLPMNGRISLLKLLRASGCDRDICDFIESIRDLRNAFAHNIKYVDDSLLTVIRTRQNWRTILRRLSPVENYNETEWLEMIQRDGGLLRFAILHYLLVFMTLAYHVVLQQPTARLDLTTLAE